MQFEDDWTTVLWDKVDYMMRLGLRPWFTAHCADPPLCGTPPLQSTPPPPAACRACALIDESEPQTLEAYLSARAHQVGRCPLTLDPFITGTARP